MAELIAAFNERLEEVETYLDMLRILEQAAQSGRPRFRDIDQPITVKQQKILYSSVYLQLYNLVESTMTSCVDAIAQAATIDPRRQARDLSLELRKEWVRFTAKTHTELTPENRLNHALELCQHLASELPISKFSIEMGGGGNWDDIKIERISNRLGLNLQVSQPVKSNIKRRLKDDLGPLGLVKKFRNQLAHGSISFSECAEEDTVAWLVDIKDKTASYLREVVAHFDSYIETHKYLVPESRPA
jgi:hypothetical protein